MQQFYEWVLYSLALLGGIAILVSGLKGVVWMVSPISTTRSRLGEHDTMLANDKRKLDQIDATLEEMKMQVSVIGLSQAELIQHILTGNDEDKLKEQHDNLLKAFMK